MSFSREEYINIAEAGLGIGGDFSGPVEDHLGNAFVAGIWNGMSPEGKEAFFRCCVLAEVVRMLEGDRRRMEAAREREEEKRLKEKRAAKRVAKRMAK